MPFTLAVGEKLVGAFHLLPWLSSSVVCRRYKSESSVWKVREAVPSSLVATFHSARAGGWNPHGYGTIPTFPSLSPILTPSAVAAVMVARPNGGAYPRFRAVKMLNGRQVAITWPEAETSLREASVTLTETR